MLIRGEKIIFESRLFDVIEKLLRPLTPNFIWFLIEKIILNAFFESLRHQHM